MILEVRDPVLVHVATRVAEATDGVARLFASAWRPTLPGARARGRGPGVEVTRVGDRVVVALRLVLDRDAVVLDVVRRVQRSVAAEVGRITGLAAEVTVVVVDLD